MHNKTIILFIAVIAMIVGLSVYTNDQSRPAETPEFKRLILLPTPREVNSVNLIDHQAEAFTLENFKGSWSLLFFGFTHCPDICPSTLLSLAQAKQQLEASGNWPKLEVYMVSVDPARDTPSRLSKYVPYFDKDFTGLVGAPDEIERFARELGILFIQNEADESGYYDVDHGVSLVLLDPQGNYAGVITAPHEPATLGQDLAMLATYTAGTERQAETAATAQVAAADQATTATGEIKASNAWLRATPPGVTSTAGYLTISNSSDVNIEITGFSSPLFEHAMLHETVIEDGMAAMQSLSQLEVNAGDKIELAPMQAHVMLMGARRDLRVDELVPLRVHTTAGDLDILAVVGTRAPE